LGVGGWDKHNVEGHSQNYTRGGGSGLAYDGKGPRVMRQDSLTYYLV
jgi:hypothetical protein